MKLIVSTPLPPRPHRRSVKGLGAKRPAVAQTRTPVAGGRDVRGFGADPCENSNDSGLGFDHHLDYQLAARSGLKAINQEGLWSSDHPETKRKKLDIKLESDDANDNFGFSETMSRGRRDMQIPGSTLTSAAGETGRVVSSVVSHSTGSIPRAVQGPPPARPLALTSCHNTGPVSLSSQLSNVSRDGRSHLQILCQPEQQHRARYQTEGSRGAVKDRSGNGFPIVKLVGYNKPAVMQVFIGTDMGRVAPHMFYQACRVSGKNSTPCVEKKVDGTIVIEVDFDPAKDMVITCDCVGILKERNVDVEHRFPDQSGTRNKKKSTRCRMVFRTTITRDDGSTEVLQTASQPIVCTQPPGVPEICKKSISSCPCTGGMEIFILGKNFLKDSRVLFQHSEADPCWEESVQPDKEFLQQTHLVCTVPPYRRIDISEPVTVKLLVMSSGKTSEPHTFTYLPTTNPVVATALQAPVGAAHLGPSCLPVAQPAAPPSMELSRVYGKPPVTVPTSTMRLSGQHLKSDLPDLKNQFHSYGSARGAAEKDVRPIMMWQSPAVSVGKEEKKQNDQSTTTGVKMLSLPPLLPLVRRAPDVQLIIPDMHTTEMKTELADESSQSTPSQLSPEDLKGIDLRMKPVTTVNQLATAADLSSTNSPSMATFRRFVSGDTYLPLPPQTGQSVEKYLSHLEGSTNNPKDDNQQISTYKIAEHNNSSSTSTAVVTPDGLSVEKRVAPFSSQPVLFETPQQHNLLTSSHVLQQQPPQKIGFVGNMQMASLYDSQERSEKADTTQKSSSRQDAIQQPRALQESVPPQSLQTTLTQPQTLEEAFTQSHTMQEAFPQHQTLQEAMTQSHSLQEAMVQSQSLQEAMAQSQSVQEVISQPHSLRDTITQPQLLPETVTQQSLQQAITGSQPLQEAHSQTVQQALTRSQSLQNAITHSQTLQEAIAQNQLMALGNLSSPPISNLCSQQASVTESPLTCGNRISEVQESQGTDGQITDNFSNNGLQRTVSENPLNIPQMISTLPEQGVVMQTSTPLIFRTTQESDNRDTVSVDTKSDDQLMESVNNNLEATTLSTGSLTTGGGHSSPVTNAQLPAGSGGLNIAASSSSSSTSVLLNQEQQGVISSSGLEALVSSAMDSHLASATEKLDAIVNSAADSHMVNQSASVAEVNRMLSSQVPVGLDDQERRGNTQQPSVLVDSIRLESSLPSVNDLNPFHLNSVRSGQQSPQISQETIILNNAVSAAIDEHLRRQDAGQKETIVSEQCGLINTSLPATTSGLCINTPSTSDSALLKNPHISPIAVKSMILDTSVTVSIDNAVLVTSPKNSSPIAVKHMNLGTTTLETEACLSNTSVAAALAAENNIHMQVPNCSSTIAVEDVINSHARNIENTNGVVSPTISLTAKNSTTELLESASCLSSAPSVSMHAHSLCSLLNSTNTSTLVSSCSQIQKSPVIITQASSVSPESLETETTLSSNKIQSQDIQNENEVVTSSHSQTRTAPCDTVESVMVSHTSLLNSMYATTSGSQEVNFSAGSSMIVGTSPVERCPGVSQIESLNNLSCTGTEVSQNSTLPADNMLASKNVNSIIGLASGGKESLETAGIQTNVGEYPVSDHKVCSNNSFTSEAKTDQECTPNNFTRIADTVEVAKTIDQQHKVAAASSLPVPVAEISSASTQAKVLATSSTVQKKCEEGMVPQELTQMSESDLISYINPSCFDQV